MTQFFGVFGCFSLLFFCIRTPFHKSIPVFNSYITGVSIISALGLYIFVPKAGFSVVYIIDTSEYVCTSKQYSHSNRYYFIWDWRSGSILDHLRNTTQSSSVPINNRNVETAVVIVFEGSAFFIWMIQDCTYYMPRLLMGIYRAFAIVLIALNWLTEYFPCSGKTIPRIHASILRYNR